MNKIYILGVGPGHKDYLLKITEKIINNSEVLIGGKRVLKIFSNLDKETIKITANLAEIKSYILDNYQDKQISVLVSGDPGLYSMMNYLKKHLDESLLEVIPGISSLQLAAARIKMNWDDLKIVSLHGISGTNNNLEEIIKKIRKNTKVGMFTDHQFSPDKIAKLLIEKEVRGKTAVVFENLSYPDERIISGNLQDIKKHSYSELSVMVVKDKSGVN